MKYIFLVMSVWLIISCGGIKSQHNISIQADENRVYIPVTIGNTTVMMLWDTGADISFFSADIAKKLGMSYENETNVIGSFTLSTLTADYTKYSPRVDVALYWGDKVQCAIGEYSYVLHPMISTLHKEYAVLGRDFMNSFYYAVYLTAKKLSLSTTPISFSDFDITDSIVFSNDNEGHIYRVKIESDSLDLLFDSGMRQQVQYGDAKYVYWDIALYAKDSNDIALKVFTDIKRRARADLTYYYKDTINVVYDSVFSVNSHQIISYIPCFMDITARRDIDGYITYGFIARFDIVYYNPKTRTMTLYKVKDYKSIMRDVSIWEYAKGVRIEQQK